jgi:hypothetical protein
MAVVRDTSKVEMIYNAEKFVRLLSPSVTDERFKKIEHTCISLLHLKIQMFIYQSVNIRIVGTVT